jgi:hypothetical protein
MASVPLQSAPFAAQLCFGFHESEIALAKKFDLRLAEPDQIHRCDRNRPVDAEECDLELVARLDSIGEHHAIGHVDDENHSPGPEDSLLERLTHRG